MLRALDVASAVARVSEAPPEISRGARNLSGSHFLLNNMILSYL